MARFLITGANGQVGHSLVQHLQGKGEVLAFHRDRLDITDMQAVRDAIRTHHPDIVINAAAYTAVDRAESEREICYAVNTKGAENLAVASAEIDAAMLHISTDYVFEGTGTEPYKESDLAMPQSVYGATKLLGEQLVQRANPRSVVLRTSWVFSEYGHNFVKTMLKLAKARDTLNVVNDQIGAPTYAGDIANALIEIAEQLLAGNRAFGTYHFSGFPYVSWYEFSNEIFQQAGLQKILANRPLVNPISTTEYPTAAKRPANSRLDLTKIHRTFGIFPSDWRRALLQLQAYQG